MKATTRSLLYSLALCLIATSCTSSLDQRISKNSAYFNSLPTTDQLLIRDGKLRIGFSKDCVVLAIGKPGRISEAVSSNGQTKEIWTYFGHQQVYTYDTWGPYSGPSCRGTIGRYHDYGPEIVFVPYLRAELTFTNGLLSAWQQVKTNG